MPFVIAEQLVELHPDHIYLMHDHIAGLHLQGSKCALLPVLIHLLLLLCKGKPLLDMNVLIHNARLSFDMILSPPSRSGGDLHTCAVIVFWRLVLGLFSSARKKASHMRLIFEAFPGISCAVDCSKVEAAKCVICDFLNVSLYMIWATSSSLSRVSTVCKPALWINSPEL
jgi:hypothetical protein